MTEDAYSAVPLILRRLVNRAAHPFGINPFPRVFHYDTSGEARAAFTQIFEENVWGSTESKSGVGSELAATARYRQGLKQVIAQYEIRSLFDAPCGDLRWMPELLRELTLDYQGGDISEAVVNAARARAPLLNLGLFDITRDEFPAVDVWHCRDCLFHLPFAAIHAAFDNVARSRVRYVLLTTHRARWLHQNLDLNGIGFRMLDLERAPFHLPRPLVYIPDYRMGREFPRYVGLWPREAIARAVEQWHG